MDTKQKILFENKKGKLVFEIRSWTDPRIVVYKLYLFKVTSVGSSTLYIIFDLYLKNKEYKLTWVEYL